MTSHRFHKITRELTYKKYFYYSILGSTSTHSTPSTYQRAPQNHLIMAPIMPYHACISHNHACTREHEREDYHTLAQAEDDLEPIFMSVDSFTRHLPLDCLQQGHFQMRKPRYPRLVDQFRLSPPVEKFQSFSFSSWARCAQQAAKGSPVLPAKQQNKT